MKRIIPFTGIFLALLIMSCGNGMFEPKGGASGDVTVTIETGGTSRTIRPNNVNASIFNKITVEFTKGNDVQILTIMNPQTSGNINLEVGTWSINALGFITIDDREYEAARGSAAVTVSSGNQNVPISLQTGIFDGNPGVFRYAIDYPATVTDAVLAITPLNDLHGYGTSNTGKTISLNQGKTGSFELLPGYYILNLTAMSGTSLMAVWNELVHIYSGLETNASHIFVTADFTGTVVLSGMVQGGELEGKHIASAVVTAYADANYINRIASVSIGNFNKMQTTPYYYTDSWSLTVPSSLVGKNVYFRVEETLNEGTGTNFWGADAIEVSASGNTGITLYSSFTWGKWVENGNNNAVLIGIEADGTVGITTSETVEFDWEGFQQIVYFNYPAENEHRYVYEFEAWTGGGIRPLTVEYINKHYTNTFLTKEFIIDTTRQTFVIVSDTRIDPYVSRVLKFWVGHQETGNLYIQLKSIKTSWDYMPPDVDGPRFTATPTAQGIHFKVDLRDLPAEITGLQFQNKTQESFFNVNFNDYDWNGNRIVPDNYEFIYPYVQAGKEYTFWLQWHGISMANPALTVTAIGGRGELRFSNASELALIREGNTVRFNKTPVLSNYNNINTEDAWYEYHVASGTSWVDLATIWRYSITSDSPIIMDLLDFTIIPPWADVSAFIGKTCFVYAHYKINYNNNDIYPTGSQPGYFQSQDINTTPFIYPNVIPNAFTAEPHPEGVKLMVDLNIIPQQTNSLYFYMAENSDNNGRLWLFQSQWPINGQNKVEIIYPFVQSGKTYTFEVDFESTGTKGRATVTAGTGLGEMTVSNLDNIGLLYNRNTKTMSYSEMPIKPVLAYSDKISREYWLWEFRTGINWDNCEWAGSIDNSSPIPVTFDETFDPALGSLLSGKPAFINPLYYIVYDGYTFQTHAAQNSTSFTFPYFDPAGYGEIYIRTAFDTNSNLFLSYNYNNPYQFMVSLDTVDGYNIHYSISFELYIDGVLLENSSIPFFSITTSDYSPGIHYGLVVVYLDGTAFAKELSFRVMN